MVNCDRPLNDDSWDRKEARENSSSAEKKIDCPIRLASARIFTDFTYGVLTPRRRKSELKSFIKKKGGTSISLLATADACE